LRKLIPSRLLNHNGSVKVSSLRTMNVTVAELAGRSWSSVQFFFVFNLTLNAY